MSIATPNRRRGRAGRRPDQEHAVDVITAAIREKLLERIDRGEELTGLGDAGDVAELVIDRLPIAVNPWAELIGPAYTSGSLQRELGVTRQALSKAAGDLRVLRLVTADGRNVYPAFQVSNGALVVGLRDVLVVLRQGVADPWTWAQWLNAAVPDRSADTGSDRLPRRNIDRLIAGDVDGVVRSAKRAAASWAA